jgi:hypothetical protein
VVDDNDTPPSGPCDTGTCTNGVPSNPLVPPGTFCDGGNCDASGACVACLTAADCPGADTGCAIRFCNNGSCGIALAPYGTPTGVQTPGDCQKTICDGLGHVVTVADDTDFFPPYYGDPCLDSICTDGVPSHPFLAAGTVCIGGGGICDGNGRCVECLDAGDCSPTGIPHAETICTDGNCAYQCLAPYFDCPNGAGCIDTNTDRNNCGACGVPCNLPNAVAGCSGGQCTILQCNPGFGDCDGNSANGCEVDTRNDPSNCGGCDVVCPTVTNGVVICANGACGLQSCNPGWAHCDLDGPVGCETNVDSDANNCGACNHACASDQSCVGGVCG